MSPTSVPSGWGSANAITSVRRRRPVARRLRRRIAAAPTSVRSTRARRAPSHASTRRAARARRAGASTPGRGLPGRRDSATGFRVIDAVVVHPGDAAHELFLHEVDLGERHGRFVELSLVQLVAYDVADRLFDL